MSLKHKWQVGVTGCQLDPGNEDCVAMASSCQDRGLDAVVVQMSDPQPCAIAQSLPQ